MDEGHDSLKIWHMKRSASGQAQRRYKELIEKTPMDYGTLFTLLENYWVDQDKIHAMAKALLMKQKAGEEISDDMLISFRIESTAQWAKKQAMLDSTSRLLIAGAGDAQEYQSFMQKYPECLVSNFKLPGTYGVIHGPPRSGKTDLACTLMNLMLGFDLDIITNIKINNPPDGIHVITTLSQLVSKLVGSNRQTVVILDETATVVSKQKPTASRSIDFQNLGRFIGKLRSSLVMVTQSFYRDVPSLIQDWTTEKYEKIGLKMVKIDLARPNGHVKMHKIFKDIPKTNLDFETHDITGLQFDISIDELLQTIADAPDKDKAIQRYISSGKEKEEEKELIDSPVSVTDTDKLEEMLNILKENKEMADQCRGTRGGVTREQVHVCFKDITKEAAAAISQRFNVWEESQKKKEETEDETIELPRDETIKIEEIPKPDMNKINQITSLLENNPTLYTLCTDNGKLTIEKIQNKYGWANLTEKEAGIIIKKLESPDKKMFNWMDHSYKWSEIEKDIDDHNYKLE